MLDNGCRPLPEFHEEDVNVGRQTDPTDRRAWEQARMPGWKRILGVETNVAPIVSERVPLLHCKALRLLEDHFHVNRVSQVEVALYVA
jgi:hypothetical protein